MTKVEKSQEYARSRDLAQMNPFITKGYEGLVKPDLPQCLAFTYLGIAICQGKGCKAKVEYHIGKGLKK